MRLRVERMHVFTVLCWLALIGCSGDDDDAASCPAGSDAGAELRCECEDGEVGVQVCGDDDQLGECDCSGESSGGSGRGGDGGSGARSGAGGRGGSGGTAGSSSPDAGTDASASDAGAMPDGGGDAMTMADAATPPDAGTTLPTNGDQLSVCEDDDDCDDGFECYDEGPGQHFCTQICEDETDCMDLSGATYTCSEAGQCEVVCENLQDAESCPDGLSCTMVSGPGPGGFQFRCKYSENAGQSGGGEAWSACLLADDCNDGLQCFGAFGPVPGYCAQSCAESVDCSEQPESGDVEPTCEPAGPPPGNNVCALDCSADPEACPDDMICGFGNRCAH